MARKYYPYPAFADLHLAKSDSRCRTRTISYRNRFCCLGRLGESRWGGFGSTMVPFDADPVYAALLASFIRDNAEAITDWSIRYYRENYTFSVGINLPRERKVQWGLSDLESIASQIENRAVNEREYETFGGDNVLQCDELLAPIMRYLESRTFHARTIAPFIWERHFLDQVVLSGLLDCLERYVQASMRENFAAFMEGVSHHRAIQRTWRLSDPEVALRFAGGSGQRDESKTDHGATVSAPNEAHADFAHVPVSLTPREREICDLVVRGLSNGEIAARLGLSQNTVKNHVSRLFEKFGVSSRSSLTFSVLGNKE